jgi:tetratricopeptide (TPR) repeat protein
MSEEMLNEAIQSLKVGQRRRAKDLLSRLLKTEPGNADYWLWMSASVETEREKIFCLQKALAADPGSVAARRGLVLLGAMTLAEANLPPVPPIEDGPVEIARVKSRPGAGAAPLSRRTIMAAAISGGVILVLAVIGFGAFLVDRLRPRANIVVITNTFTATAPGGEAGATGTATPTQVRSTLCPLPSTLVPSTPLAAYLCLTQTPVPLPFPTEKTIYESYQRMMRAYTAGDWARVSEYFGNESFQTDVPDNPRVYFMAAEAYRGLRDYRNALRWYNQSLNLDRSFAPAFLGRALTQIGLNNGTEALKDFENAIKANPKFVTSYVDRGVFYSVNGNYPRALEDLEMAKKLAPRDARVLASLASVYLDSGAPEQALQAAEDAIALDPSIALAYYTRGRALFTLGQYEAADRDLSLSYGYMLADQDTVARMYEKLYIGTVHFNYGLGKMGIGDSVEAIEAFTKALDSYSSLSAAQVARGRLYLTAGDYEAARKDFNAVITALAGRTDPMLYEAYLGNGLALLATDKPEGAVTNFQAAARGLPDDFEVNLGLGESLVLTGKPEDALPNLEAAARLAVEDMDRMRVYYWQAQAYAALKRPALEATALIALEQLGGTGTPGADARARLTEIGPLPTATKTATPTRTATPARTVTPTRTPTSSITPTATRAEDTPTATPSFTASPKPTSSATRTAGPTSTPTASRTPSATATATP